MKKLVITITNNISFDQRMLKIADHYSKNFDVTIIGSNTRKPPKLQSRKFKQHRIKTFFKKGFLFYSEFNLRLLIFLLKNRFDIVYSVDLDTILTGYCLKRIKGIPYIFDAHEYFTELPELINRTFVQKVWRYIENLAVPSAESCVTVNMELAEIFKEKHGQNFLVVRNTPIVIQNCTFYKENIFIYQGALNEGRGVEQLIEMMKYFPKYRLEIAGDGPLRVTLQKLKDKLKLDNVIFHGMLNAEELRQLTSKAMVGFNLLLGESLNYYYSLANKFFDYVMLETPVITMDFPVYSRLLKEHEVGILLESLDVNKLVTATNNMILDPIQYDLFVDNCKRAKKKWNWEIDSKQLDELISI
jgi:glycosyltransferase involved in cell wall biosynthesis